MKHVHVADTSVLIDARILDLIIQGKISGKIILSKASIAELEHQANFGRETGFAGFSTIKKLKELDREKSIELEILGERPTPMQITNAKKTGELDYMIRSIAKECDATLITGDKVQYESALAEGINSMYLEPREKPSEISFEKFFDNHTMSVHIKENTSVKAKKGAPGNWKLVDLNEKFGTEKIRKLSEEIIETAERNKNFYFEMDLNGATVMQMGQYRVVITKPPFSDGFEITAVRPIKKLSLKEYSIEQKLLERLDMHAEGVLICGSPGSGKSTFASALAEYYKEKKKIVKTIENPRDMQLSEDITQYTKLNGSFENTKDILLLVRPDYAFYDEVRKTEDFEFYADMRLSGIGLVGVVHAKKTIDAIQRFINKVELGLIPQIVDTVISIEGGKIDKVYMMQQVMKVPTGMVERDLSRPVIEVRNFFTSQLEYEIYKFGEETVVLEVSKAKVQTAHYPQRLESILKRFLSQEFKLEKTPGGFILHANSRDTAKLFNKYRKKFEKLAKKYSIEVKPL